VRRRVQQACATSGDLRGIFRGMCAALQTVHIVDSDTSSLTCTRASSRVNQAQRVWGRDLNAAGGSSTDKIPPRHYNGSGQGVRRRLHAVRKLGTLDGGSNHFHIAGARIVSTRPAFAPHHHQLHGCFSASIMAYAGNKPAH
jgi:hypothetical protein